MGSNGNSTDSRSLLARRVGGYGAAGAVALYLAVKAVWVVGALAGLLPSGLDASRAEWIALNTTTIGMAAVGVALGLALAQPWGLGLPGPLVVGFAWIAAGFLVSMLPHTALVALLGSAGSAEEAAAPLWDTVLITVGFAGTAVGLLVAAPFYLRERWPGAFTGAVGDVEPDSRRACALVIAAAAVPTALWIHWAAGGTTGLDPDTLDRWNRDARLLYAVSAAWALLGCWSAWSLASRRPPRLPRLPPVAVGFVASGSLFAWNAWRLALTLVPVGDLRPFQRLPFALAEHAFGMVAGLALLAIVLRVAGAGPRAGRSAAAVQPW
jgi:hypothetical protein